MVIDLLEPKLTFRALSDEDEEDAAITDDKDDEDEDDDDLDGDDDASIDEAPTVDTGEEEQE